jgi:predicted dehydrogenase
MLGYWKWYEKDGHSDMEWQCRSWPWFTWTSGDHIVEQHVHNLDVLNWALQAHPLQCIGMGGRAVRDLGNIYDHFAVEYEYPNGVRVSSMCRQINGSTGRIAEHVVGTKGVADVDRGVITGEKPFTYDGPDPDHYVQEMADLIKSIRDGSPINEGKQVAESTMNAIMGRMSAYTGRALKWDWAMNASKLDLTPPKYGWIDLPVRPVAVPGKTQLI